VTDKSDVSPLMTSESRDVQLANHRRQLSADSTSSLLLANADDLELNRFTRNVTIPSVNEVERNDVSTLEHQQSDNSLVHISGPATDRVASSSQDEDGVSAPDEPLLSNAFGNTPCK